MSGRHVILYGICRTSDEGLGDDGDQALEDEKDTTRYVECYKENRPS